MKIRNNGVDAAENVKLRFNVMIGEEDIVTTVWTDEVAWRIEPGDSSGDKPMVISADKDDNAISISLNELKSIECGAPLMIEITEISAQVPWRENAWTAWDLYTADVEPVSSTIVFDSGDGKVRTYYVWSGTPSDRCTPPPIHS